MQPISKNIKLPQLLKRVHACTVCASALPLGPRPLVQAGDEARVIIIGQAPGNKAHESRVPWDDASGKRLRDWLGLAPEQFYAPGRIALMPMGFCYPGKGASGDLPPREECAPLWHEAILDRLPNLRLMVLIGQYAINHYAPTMYRSLTEAVADYDALLPRRIALPHPSPRNNRWLAKNAWFERDVLPRLRKRVKAALKR